MDELPPELGVDAAVAIIAAVDGGRGDAGVALFVAAALAIAIDIAVAALRWRLPDRHYAAAIAFGVLFPLAARLATRRRLARLRRLDAGDLRLRAAAAWERASPGQRAALLMLTKKSA
jgi:hypothetical protein